MSDSTFTVLGLDFDDCDTEEEVIAFVSNFDENLKAVNINEGGPNGVPYADIVGPEESLKSFLCDYFSCFEPDPELLELIIPYEEAE